MFLFGCGTAIYLLEKSDNESWLHEEMWGDSRAVLASGPTTQFPVNLQSANVLQHSFVSTGVLLTLKVREILGKTWGNRQAKAWW